jgi:hypothetical protein
MAEVETYGFDLKEVATALIKSVRRFVIAATDYMDLLVIPALIEQIARYAPKAHSRHIPHGRSTIARN